MTEAVVQRPSVVPPGAGKTVQLLAATIEAKTPDGHSPGVLEMVAEPSFPGPQPHVHRLHDEIFYVLEGCFDFLVGEQVTRVEAGTVVHVPIGVVHDFRNPGPGRARLLGIATPGNSAYFDEVGEMLTSGAFTLEKLGELREKYETEEVAVDW